MQPSDTSYPPHQTSQGCDPHATCQVPTMSPSVSHHYWQLYNELHNGIEFIVYIGQISDFGRGSFWNEPAEVLTPDVQQVANVVKERARVGLGSEDSRDHRNGLCCSCQGDFAAPLESRTKRLRDATVRSSKSRISHRPEPKAYLPGSHCVIFRD